MKRHLASLLVLLTVLACDKRAPDAAGNTSTSVTPLVSAPAAEATPSTGWDAALGTLVATPALETGAPVIFTRDSLAVGTVAVDLFNHDAQVLHGSLALGASRSGTCNARRDGTLDAGTTSAPIVWSLALPSGIATPLGIDAMTELAPKDSARLAAIVSRLVGALPDDSAAAMFRGLPIVVRDAWRLTLPDSTPVIVAVATRTLNVESNPRAQVVTLLAEPESRGSTDAWRTVFARRASGPEDQVEGADLLAALHFTSGPIAVALVRERDSGLDVEFVERVTPGAWRVRWSSSARVCAR